MGTQGRRQFQGARASSRAILPVISAESGLGYPLFPRFGRGFCCVDIPEKSCGSEGRRTDFKNPRRVIRFF